ncbi:hypothetical protein, partial [Burkholderia cenocepacia]
RKPRVGPAPARERSPDAGRPLPVARSVPGSGTKFKLNDRAFSLYAASVHPDMRLFDRAQ